MNAIEPTWQYQHFDALSTVELYKILQLRNTIFVVEQNCPYQDADDKDVNSYHLSGWYNETLVAYCRIIPPGISYNNPSIGRVVVDANYRKYGLGFKLMTAAIDKALLQFNQPAITIGAQLYLKKFYESLGFIAISEIYLEDGIPHITMQLGR